MSNLDSCISVMNSESNEFMGNIVVQNAKYPSSFSFSKRSKSVIVTMSNFDINTNILPKNNHFGKEHKEGFMLKLSTQNGSTLASSKIHGVNLDAEYSNDEAEIWTTHFHDIDDKEEVGRVLILDSHSLLEKRFIEVGNAPIDIAFSKNGQKVFVLNYGSESVSIIDAKNKFKITDVKVGKNPTKLIVSDENQIFVLNNLDKSISVIDGETNKLSRTYQLDVKPTSISFSPHGELWICSNESNKLYFYSRSADIRTGEMNCGNGCNDIAFSSDGKYCFVVNKAEGSISKIDVNSKKMTKTQLQGLQPTKISALN